MEYEDFLRQKQIQVEPVGIDIDRNKLNPVLFDFQKDIVKWALKKGRAAIFSGCGTGKTVMQLEWAKHIHNETDGNILILAPLAVNFQTVEEGRDKLGIDVNPAESQEDIKPGINITNYEKLHKFNPDEFIAVVLDESSILKSYTSKTRNQIIQSFEKKPYKLACTATPAPNDYVELGNHSDFLGVMSGKEMLSMFFINDNSSANRWRLKGHAQDKFWQWVTNWAVTLRKPSDLGYKDEKFILPPLNVKQETVKLQHKPTETLFHVKAESLMERKRARRESIEDRVQAAANIANNSNEDTWLIWCDLNKESKLLTKAINGAVEVTGSQSNKKKEETMMKFSDGEVKILVTKPSICGHGMNWQHCNNVIFVGLSDSYEQYYQAVRRTWRFGQQKPVNVYVITAETEGNVVENIKRKEKDAENMAENMVKYMKNLTVSRLKGTQKEFMHYENDKAAGTDWELVLGDSVEEMKSIKDNSIDYSIFSPPFDDLYIYTNSERDISNSKDSEEFMQHMKYIADELYRVIKEGRLISFHCMNLPTTKSHDGFIGIRNFRGELVELFRKAGFIYHSEAVIHKDPVVAMSRTHAKGLLYSQVRKDSTCARASLPDYLITMRKPGENKTPVKHDEAELPLKEWIKYAQPIWDDIQVSNVITYRSAKGNNDEKHLTPTPLEALERGIALYSNKGETVFSPFAGVCSEGYQAVKMGRKFKGIELKRNYFEQGIDNLNRANQEKNQISLF
ncbi:DNA methyltransferase [Halocella sp. SP3-1]|uniref:DNA methyltransferase n=1 Tax=Halocella sp. SP3-1 TaxID=2382161 RepID=UPI00197A9CA6|nr:DNA methyltransferase [Halocella sp. SP3-1]